MQPYTFSYSSMGTTWTISMWDGLSELQKKEIQDAIQERSKNFDETYSRFIKNSFVWQIAEKRGRITVPKDFMNMLKYYFKFYELSNKKLNPLIGNTISDMGYDADYSLKPKEIIRLTPDLDDTVKIVSDSEIELTQPALFDFGALGKGYFVDAISVYLREKGVKRFLVNGSGDIFYEGNGEEINVGLEDPEDNKKIIAHTTMKQGAMCASGINRRQWGEHHHVVDPHTGTSTKYILATWVLAKNTTLADTLASCLFFVAPEVLLPHFQFDYVVMNEERKIKSSPGMLLQL